MSFSGTVSANAVVAASSFTSANASFSGNVGVQGTLFGTSLQCTSFAMASRVVQIETVNINGQDYDLLVAQ